MPLTSRLPQIKASDFRTTDELAVSSRMPVSPELKDLSRGLEQARKLEDAYGLQTDIVVVHDAGIRVTSLKRNLLVGADAKLIQAADSN